MQELLEAVLAPLVELALYGVGRPLLWMLGFDATDSGQLEEIVGLVVIGLGGASAAYFLGAFDAGAVGATAGLEAAR
jgi:hypothetical protein